MRRVRILASNSFLRIQTDQGVTVIRSNPMVDADGNAPDLTRLRGSAPIGVGDSVTDPVAPDTYGGNRPPIPAPVG